RAGAPRAEPPPRPQPPPDPIVLDRHAEEAGLERTHQQSLDLRRSAETPDDNVDFRIPIREGPEDAREDLVVDCRHDTHDELPDLPLTSSPRRIRRVIQLRERHSSFI